MAWYVILTNLCARIFVVLILFSILCRTAIIRETINTLHERIRSKIHLVLFFSFFGAVDLVCGILLPTVVVNNHSTYVISAGLIGGPAVGLATAGIISVGYIALISPVNLLSVILTVAESIIAGLLSKWLHKQKYIFVHAGVIGYTLTSLYIAFLAVFTPDVISAPFTLEDVIFPLLFSVTVGTGSFMGLLEDYYNQQEKFEGISAKIALKITNSTLSILQNGLDKKSASETVEIIIRDSETFDFVAITSMDEILGFTSYRTESPFVSFLKNDFMKLFKSDFSIPAQKLDVIRACLTVPLYDDKRKYGYLCAGHILENRVTPMEETLINGIGTMISTQLTYHIIKEKADLLQQAEIKALQSQINPHFLFNALSTISYYCTQQPQTAKTLINDLANYYRKNLTDADTMITIREELQHIGAYIHLEQARFRERLKVDYELNTENSFMLPALILQPLVENAIKHGLYPKITGGKITIRIDEKPSYFRITVIDDGMGIAREKLATILDDSVPKKSIGLSNVNKRLNTLYGIKNRLRICSRVDKGTIVSMRIPVQEVTSTQ
ncbi:MAG: histidine kinase [Acidaminococcaceae bacterium]|nr:histidine kinase [Acidaminococcaceae bacterium]MBQ9257676.1 histidine kinase [Acidaminococcaceae bacterium]